MYSLNDITGGSKKLKVPENKTNNNQTISISETSFVRVEISEPMCSTVRHQTISLPRESIYEVQSCGKITTDEDVLNIQISNVQGADQTADQATNKVLLPKENHTDKLRNQEILPALHVATQREIPLVKHFPGGKRMNFNQIAKYGDISREREYFADRRPLSKDMITENKRYQDRVDPNVPCSANQSSILNGEPLTDTAGIRNKLLPKLNFHEPEISSSFYLSPQAPATSQQSNHHKSSDYQMSTNGTVSACHDNTTKALYTHPQHSGTASVSSHQVSGSTPHPYFYMSSNSTVPLYHMDETTTAQAQDGETNTSYQANYRTEMPKYFDNNTFNAYHQGMPYWSTENHNMASNNQMTACSCSCSCYGKSGSRLCDAINPKNQRPSVIMVPVSWSSGDSGISHLPLKVKIFTSQIKLLLLRGF